MEGFKVSDADLTVYIHPSKSNKIQEAILHQLSSMLFKFNEAFDGVLLAYDVNIQSGNAKILPGISPYLGVKLKAKLLLFSPKPGMLLEGKVAKLGKDTIHVIVLGFSSAAISFDDIREEFKYRIDRSGREKLVSKSHKRHAIRVGSVIRFLVKSLDEEILHISGSLIPSNTGCVHWLSSHSTEDDPQTDSCDSGEKRAMRVITINVVRLSQLSQPDLLLAWSSQPSDLLHEETWQLSSKKQRKRERELDDRDQGILVLNSGQKHKSKIPAGD